MATEATTSVAEENTALRQLTDMVRAMFPHPSFPDGPYQRSAQAILDAADADVRLRTQLDQGLRDLDAIGGAPFAELDPARQLEILRGINSTEFFAGVRGAVITSLYDDREVWSLLGYEGASYPAGGYITRGFDDLDWLPTPRIEEAS
jgi:hypothetical protein